MGYCDEDYGLDAMKYMHKYRQQQIEDMKSYLDNLKNIDVDKAKEKAKDSLIKSGVIDEKGNIIRHME